MRLRLVVPALSLAVAVLAQGCSSPNRGEWKGDFDGSVTGTVDFTINTRGTKLTGTMAGKTSGGQDFHATMEGTLAGVDLVAELEGSATTDYRPVPFTGVMKGELLRGKAHGSWECTIRFTDQKMNGDWRVTQVVAAN